jgi:hypothetical protein
MEYPGGPFKPTRDFDWWDITPGAPISRPTVFLENIEDTDPNAVIGGGELNRDTAAVLHEELAPELTVFAYGKNSPAFAAAGFPSESSILSGLFLEMMRGRNAEPRVEIFDPDFWDRQGKITGSGTFQEIKNIFYLANLKQFDEVVIVTILLHLARVVAMVTKHLADPEFAGLREKVRFEVSELVLLRKNPQAYAERAWKIYGSQSYVRNLKREVNALENMYKGVTQTIQPGFSSLAGNKP